MFTASLFPVGLLPSNIVFDPIEASAQIIDNDGNYSCSVYNRKMSSI